MLIAKSLSDGAKIIPRDLDSQEFTLYKNSRFKECYNREPYTECDRIKQILQNKTDTDVFDTYTDDGLGKLASSHFTTSYDKPEFAFS